MSQLTRRDTVTQPTATVPPLTANPTAALPGGAENYLPRNIDVRAEDEEAHTTLFLAPDATCGKYPLLSLSSPATLGSWFTCLNGNVQCQFYTSSSAQNAWQACCGDYLSCDPWTTCLDHDQSPAWSYDASKTKVCTSNSFTLCQTLHFSYHSALAFVCVPPGIARSLEILTTHVGQEGVLDFTTTTIGVSESSSSSSSSSSTAAPTTITTTTSTISDGASGSPSSGGGGGGGQSSHVGAIVGGVLGGLAIIGIVVLGGVYFLVYQPRRKGGGGGGGVGGRNNSAGTADAEMEEAQPSSKWQWKYNIPSTGELTGGRGGGREAFGGSAATGGYYCELPVEEHPVEMGSPSLPRDALFRDSVQSAGESDGEGVYPGGRAPDPKP
ncbi:hypothetical protein MKZ38_001027 [Zalerion maritima]|uniref:Transmembrane protein n=1 Tax=Zalerion maritima TaxID=339359 RepID=A0AAD5RQV9_9PEZI|nr:hypothetical protein MKZ38_001027 [Zalerion maritima]